MSVMDNNSSSVPFWADKMLSKIGFHAPLIGKSRENRFLSEAPLKPSTLSPSDHFNLFIFNASLDIEDKPRVNSDQSQMVRQTVEF